ncbi:MAG: polyprenyl synthetase family protein, partial [Chloroflexota bacterium]
ELLMPMSMAVELFHTATLVHDDIVDKAPVRRGLPTVNSLWGQELALLLGDFLFSQAAELVSATGNLRVIELFAHTLMEVSGGELKQNLISLEAKQDRQHYYQWIGAKTASVFTLATQSGAVLSQATEAGINALVEYGYNLGMAFQVADDILDVVGEAGEMGKPVGWDLFQGSPTLPAIILMESYPGKEELNRALARQEEGARDSQLLLHSSLIQECYEIGEGFAAKAAKALEIFSESPAKLSLSQLAEYAVRRRR